MLETTDNLLVKIFNVLVAALVENTRLLNQITLANRGRFLTAHVIQEWIFLQINNRKKNNLNAKVTIFINIFV